MPKNLPAKCKFCGKRRADGHTISRRGRCPDCAQSRLEAAIRLNQANATVIDAMTARENQGAG